MRGQGFGSIFYEDGICNFTMNNLVLILKVSNKALGLGNRNGEEKRCGIGAHTHAQHRHMNTQATTQSSKQSRKDCHPPQPRKAGFWTILTRTHYLPLPCGQEYYNPFSLRNFTPPNKTASSSHPILTEQRTEHSQAARSQPNSEVSKIFQVRKRSVNRTCCSICLTLNSWSPNLL